MRIRIAAMLITLARWITPPRVWALSMTQLGEIARRELEQDAKNTKDPLVPVQRP